MLFGLGQCYADFYHRQHPNLVFDPMTEYQELLDKTFKNPTGFFDAMKRNPAEFLRYACLNGFNNLSILPKEIFKVRSQYWGSNSKWRWKLLLFVLIGGITVSLFGISRRGASLKLNRQRILAITSRPNFWKVFYLCILGITPILSILLLVPSPRYWISLVPILYLLLACCFDILLRRLRLVRYEHLFTGISLIVFCTPNFLLPRPNYRASALRHIASHTRSNPVVGAWWADPDCVFGFSGNATAVSINNGIYGKDIADGRFDVLIFDPNFRGTKTWDTQREFFDSFEHDPVKYGFRKLTELPTGTASIFYREKPSAAVPGDAL